MARDVISKYNCISRISQYNCRPVTCVDLLRVIAIIDIFTLVIADIPDSIGGGTLSAEKAYTNARLNHFCSDQHAIFIDLTTRNFGCLCGYGCDEFFIV